MNEAMPSTFANYEILGKLGQGGMGTVYRARDPQLDRIVALKVMNPGVASAESAARFQREIQVLSRLRHPNIIRLFAAGRHKNRLYFSMDYIEGKPLSRLIKEAETFRDRMELVPHVATIAHALHYAHGHGVIHRDVKPSNVIVTEDGEPFITDFGLAKELDAAQTITLPGAAIGTAAYISPEQAEGDQERIGPRTDVYALGAMLYEVLTGKPPFEGPTPAAILQKAARENPVRPRKFNRRIGLDLEIVCLKCLEKEPRYRYQNAAALADDLDRYAKGEAVLVRRPFRFVRIVRDYPLRAVLAVAMALAGVVLVLRIRDRSSSTDSSGFALTEERIEQLRKEIEEAGREKDQARRAEKEREGRLGRTAQLDDIVGKQLQDIQARREKQELAQRRKAMARVPLARAKARITSYCKTGISRCLAVGRQEVWLGTDAGACKLDLSTGKLSFLPLGAEVNDIAEDDNHKWWFGTRGNGLFSFDGHMWRRYGIESGPASASIYEIVVDQENTIWFGTGRGVSRFDGEKWTTYTSEDGLGGNGITALRFDGRGHVWAISWSGALSSFDGTAWRARRESEDSSGRLMIRTAQIDGSGRVWLGGHGVKCFDGSRWYSYGTKDRLLALGRRVAIDPEGKVWIGGYGVSCFDGKNWTNYIRWNLRKDGPDITSIKVLAVDSKGMIWCAGSSGASCFDGRTWKTYTSEDGLATGDVEAMVVDAEGRIWCGSDIHGVSRFDGRVWKTYTNEDGLAEGAVEAMVVDAQGRVWCSSSIRGVSRFDGGVWKTYASEDGLAEGTVEAMVVDAQGRVWCGSSRGGVSCFSGEVWRAYTEKDGLGIRSVDAMLIDTKGRVWCGSRSGGVSCFDGKSWKTYSKEDGLGISAVETMAVDKQGRIWFGSYSGLSRFDGTAWKTYTSAEAVASASLSDIAADPDGGIWCVGLRGVSHFDGEHWNNYTSNEGLVHDSVLCSEIDKEGRAWFGTVGGVSRFDGESWMTYGRGDGLSAGHVNAIAADERGGLWFGSDSGVSRFDGNTWTTYTSQDGLSSGSVRTIAFGDDGRAWIGTTMGMCSFNGEQWEQYSQGEGLPDSRINTIAVDSKGRKWFGTPSGVACLDKEDWSVFDEDDGLAHNSVNAIAADSENLVWFGTDNGASCYDGVAWVNYTEELGHVTDIAIDEHNRKWFGTSGRVRVFDGTTWETPGQASDLQAPGNIRCIEFTPDGGAWCTDLYGMWSFDGNTWERRHLPVDPNGVFAIDDRGLVWSMPYGKARLSNLDGRLPGAQYGRMISRILNSEGEPRGAESHGIVSDPGGRVWFGTNKGLSCFDGEVWRTWTTDDFLAGNDVTSLAVDLDGSIWAGTTTGVSHIVLVEDAGSGINAADR